MLREGPERHGGAVRDRSNEASDRTSTTHDERHERDQDHLREEWRSARPMKLTMAGQSDARDDGERHYDGGGNGEHAHRARLLGRWEDHDLRRHRAGLSGRGLYGGDQPNHAPE